MMDFTKSVAHVVATVLALPWLLSYWARSALLGRDRALEGSSQSLAGIPGLPGQYLRRAFLAAVLDECHRSACIEFGVLFSKAGTRIGENVYIGPRCHIGLAHIGRDALLAAGVHVPSGAHIHGSEDPDAPIRDQPGVATVVRIGAGAWVGSGAVVMADVGAQTIVGAGAVVTKPLPDRVVAGGVPAKVIRHRGSRVGSQ
jgi:acetyltransferase-like isoleucine patch superfamily enzyme